VVNAIIDAAYRSVDTKRWEPVKLEVWRGSDSTEASSFKTDDGGQFSLIKQERMPDGKLKRILKDKNTGRIVEEVG
jgi:hypothetical protein